MPDTSVDDSGAGTSAAAARQILTQLPKDAPAAAEAWPAQAAGGTSSDIPDEVLY